MRKRRDALQPKVWKISSDGVADIAALATAGDRISAADGRGQQWRELRRSLASRGLPVVRLGHGLFVLPRAAASQSRRIEAVAYACEGEHDRVAGRALLDLLDEFNLQHAQGEIRRSCRTLPRRRRLPGGHLDGEPRERERRGAIPPEGTRLSRLQRELLAYALACVDVPGGAPLRQFRPHVRRGADRSASAALSRATRRLEERGLVRLTRSDRGYVSHLALTPLGVAVARG
jgi:hypothetical protein